MTATSSSDRPVSIVATDKIYSEVRTGIRETDSISFKLLGLVPLVSGAALIGLMLQNRELLPGLVGILALFAASITLGLFRWEMRNVQTCSWLINYAAAIESRALADKTGGTVFRPRPAAPQGIGKSEAEKWIYGTTIAAWLALPVAMGVAERLPYRWAFVLSGALIALVTVVSLFANPRVEAW